MNEKSVLCIGIAVLDITAGVMPAPKDWRQKQRIEKISLQIGGDAANQSLHLAALGLPTYFCGCVGADANGSSLLTALKGRGVDTSLSCIRGNTGTALVLINSQGERNIFSATGTHSSICRADLPDEIPPNCGAISLGSLFGMPLLEEDGLCEFLEEARRRGILVFADLDSGNVVPGCERIERLFPCLDYLVPSDYDILPLTGQKTREDAVAWLRGRGVRNVIVKCGADGCEIFGEGGHRKIPAPVVDVVDTTGAGDCMSAALIARVLAGDALPEACRYACACGSYSTLFPGASTLVLSEQEVRARFAQYLSKTPVTRCSSSDVGGCQTDGPDGL